MVLSIVDQWAKRSSYSLCRRTLLRGVVEIQNRGKLLALVLAVLSLGSDSTSLYGANFISIRVSI